MSNKLNIYACSGVGDAGQERKARFFYDYWLDNTRTVSNTQAVNTLLAMINSNYTDAAYLQLTTEERVRCLNNIDLLCCCLYYAKEYSGRKEDLHRAGNVIGSLYEDGFFEYDSIDNNDRDTHLDNLLNRLAEMVGDDTKQASGAWLSWWEEKVESRDKVAWSKELQEQVTQTLAQGDEKLSGIGDLDWQANADLSQYLNNSKDYFMYLYFTDEQIRKMGNKRIELKRAKQQRVYDYCKAAFTDLYGSEDELQSIIRDSIKATFGCTPEKVCEDIVAGTRDIKAIGVLEWTIPAIIELVAALLSFVLGVISIILTCVAQVKAAKYAAVDKQTATGAIPDAGDYDPTMLKKKSDNTMLLAAGAIALLFILKD